VVRAALAGDAGALEGIHAASDGSKWLDPAEHGWGADVGGGGTFVPSGAVAPGGEKVNVIIMISQEEGLGGTL
jgi:hypothetical protein